MPFRLLAAISALLFAIFQGWLLQLDGRLGSLQTSGLEVNGSTPGLPLSDVSGRKTPD